MTFPPDDGVDRPAAAPLPGPPRPTQPHGAPQPSGHRSPAPGPGPAAHAPGPGPAPGGTIAVTLQGSAMTVGLLTPQVRIDGFPVAAGYGATFIPVPAGRHRVEVHSTWIVQYGRAAYDVDVAPGATVPVYYATPWIQFADGSIGPTPQKRRGLGILLAIMAVVILVAIVVPILLALH